MFVYGDINGSSLNESFPVHNFPRRGANIRWAIRPTIFECFFSEIYLNIEGKRRAAHDLHYAPPGFQGADSSRENLASSYFTKSS